VANKKKKRRKPAATSAGTAASTSPLRPPATQARREHKEAARRRREQQAKAAMRRSAFKRAAIGGVVGVVVFVGVSWFVNRAPAPTPLSQTAIDVGLAAGCADLVTPSADPARNHLDAGASYTYDQHPATSGPHDPYPLPDQPRVYTAADLAGYHETQAVHSLEHGSVIMYYRPSGDPGGLPSAVVDQLASVATGDRSTYLIPYPDLPQDTALAFTAWNKLLTCPAKITPEQAATLAQGFITSFVCTSNAPEGNRGYGC
jgi:hypothetical protein